MERHADTGAGAAREQANGDPTPGSPSGAGGRASSTPREPAGGSGSASSIRLVTRAPLMPSTRLWWTLHASAQRPSASPSTR